MSKFQRYQGITPAVWACMQSQAIKAHGTKYVPADGMEGTATTTKMGQTVVLRFELDFAANTLVYTLVSKGMLVPEGAIWDGIAQSIAECKATAG